MEQNLAGDLRTTFTVGAYNLLYPRDNLVICRSQAPCVCLCLAQVATQLVYSLARWWLSLSHNKIGYKMGWRLQDELTVIYSIQKYLGKKEWGLLKLRAGRVVRWVHCLNRNGLSLSTLRPSVFFLGCRIQIWQGKNVCSFPLNAVKHRGSSPYWRLSYS